MPLFSQRLETRRLKGSDMKKLVRILQGVPNRSIPDEEDGYHKQTKDSIKTLPRGLRAAFVCSSNKLCYTHKGLDHHLVYNIWAWVKHEFEGAIGDFLYPLIMCGLLTPYQETTIRQLEPVIEMWREDFTLAASAPPGHIPIKGGRRWHFQDNECPACLLARIGSDMDILGALFAGMVGRNNSTNRSFFGPEDIKAKRLRFVRYWMQSRPGGTQEVCDAYEFGVKLKKMRVEAKKRMRCEGKSYFYKRNSFELFATQEAGTDVPVYCDARDWFPDEHVEQPRHFNASPALPESPTLPRTSHTDDRIPRSPSPPTPRAARRASDLIPQPPMSPEAKNPYASSACYSPPTQRVDSLHAPLFPSPDSIKQFQLEPFAQTSSTLRPASSVYSQLSRASYSTIMSYDRAPAHTVAIPPRPAPIDRFLALQAQRGIVPTANTSKADTSKVAAPKANTAKTPASKIPTPKESPAGTPLKFTPRNGKLSPTVTPPAPTHKPFDPKPAASKLPIPKKSPNASPEASAKTSPKATSRKPPTAAPSTSKGQNTRMAPTPGRRPTAIIMPLPRPQSIYSSFSDARFDGGKFDYVDESPPPTPRSSNGSSGMTRWGDLY